MHQWWRHQPWCLFLAHFQALGINRARYAIFIAPNDDDRVSSKHPGLHLVLVSNELLESWWLLEFFVLLSVLHSLILLLMRSLRARSYLLALVFEFVVKRAPAIRAGTILLRSPVKLAIKVLTKLRLHLHHDLGISRIRHRDTIPIPMDDPAIRRLLRWRPWALLLLLVVIIPNLTMNIFPNGEVVALPKVSIIRLWPTMVLRIVHS